MKGNKGKGLATNPDNVVTFGGANIGTITIIPGYAVNFTNGIAGVIITNNNGVVLNIQDAIAPSTITSFEDHFDIHPLGVAPDESEAL
jgi:hypothetical protein